MFPCHPPSPQHAAPIPARHPWRLALGSAVLALAACSSTPLPPWPDPVAKVVRAPASMAPPAAPPAAVAEIEVETLPISPAGIPVPEAIVPAATLPATPYSAAVAQRFPDPAIAYATPGLQAGRSSFTSNAEISEWLHTLAARPGAGVRARVLDIGASQQGAALQALLLTRAASPDAASVLASARPTVLLVAQQHGNEPAGSEAALVVARELAQGLLEPLLDKINVLIVPRANPDGAAAEQRATANGIDLDHDQLLLNTPEARALAQLGRDYQPMVVLDAREYTVLGRYLQKFGYIQKYDALLQYAMTANLPEFLTRAAEEWYRRPLLAALKSQGLSSEWYYTSTESPEDHRLSMGGVGANNARNVNGLKNAVSLLVATRGVGMGRMHLQRRVHTQVTAMVSVLQSTASRAEQLGQLRPYIDRETSSLACHTQAIVDAGPTSVQYELSMLDPATGADRRLTVDWDSALELQTLKSRPRPCGYWLSNSSAEAVARLQQLGVLVFRVAEPGSLLGDLYRASGQASHAADGSAIAPPEVALVRSLVDVSAGSYYVPLGQAWGNLVLAALEPDTRSSYFANHLLGSLDDTVRVMAEPTLRLEKLP